MKNFFLTLLVAVLFGTNIFAALSIPTLSSPANGASDQNPNVSIDWGSVSGASYYEFKLGTDPSLTTELPQSSGSNSYYSTSELLFGTVYYWQVRAMSATDSSGWSSIWNFTTKSTITLSSPSNGATNQAPSVSIDWSSLSGITYYDYQLDTTPDFNSSLYEYGSTSASYSYKSLSDLLFGTTYYWRARARHNTDTTQWSLTWHFTTTDIITNTSPSNGAINQSPSVSIDWNSLSGITYYDYQLDTTPDFNSSLYEYGSTTSGYSSKTLSDLLFGTTYYWRARARHNTDTTQWSLTWHFTTTDIITNTSPSNGAINQAPNVSIDWSTLSGITYYDYQLDTTPDFNSSLYEYGSTTSGYSSKTLSDLLFGTTYYWRARARHTADTTQWSGIWHFTTTDMLSNTSPSNGAINQAPNVSIDWSTLSGITYYDYQLDTTPDFNSSLYEYGSTTSGYSSKTLSDLLFGTTYYWRARARHTADTTQWTAIWNFTTTYGVSLVSPLDNATNVSLNPTIDWSLLSGITSYHYQYDTDVNFSNPMYFTQSTSSSQANISNLSYGTTYHWQVRVAHNADTSDWTAPWLFTTLYQITDGPELISPPDLSTELTIPVNIEWNSVSGAIYYEYQYDSIITFNNPFSNTTSNLNEDITNLNTEITYYWKVRANNGSGFSPWSDIWSFTTELSTGIDNITDKNIIIYPNPVNSTFRIITSNNIHTLSYKIYDESGKEIVKETYINNNSLINILNLANGVYFLGIKIDNNKYKLKKIIKH